MCSVFSLSRRPRGYSYFDDFCSSFHDKNSFRMSSSAFSMLLANRLEFCEQNTKGNAFNYHRIRIERECKKYEEALDDGLRAT